MFTPAFMLKSGYKVDSADFDGSTQKMTRGANLTGIANSKSGIFSAWVRLDGGNGTDMMLLNGLNNANTIGPVLWRTSANTFIIQEVTAKYYIASNNTYTSGASWLHVLSSWDGATGAAHLYINDADDKAVGSAATNVNTAYSSCNDWACGESYFTAFGVHAWFNGCMAEVYFAPGQYLDFSNSANRRKFRSAVGKPVNLGTDGSTPTGTAPCVYFHLKKAEAVANFATNRGSGGNFSITAGPLATGSTSPSD